MNQDETVIEGTVNPDGSLLLDEALDLPPGRVTVVVRQESVDDDPSEDWWEFMQRSRRELEAAGSKFMNDAESEAHINWLRNS